MSKCKSRQNKVENNIKSNNRIISSFLDSLKVLLGESSGSRVFRDTVEKEIN